MVFSKVYDLDLWELLGRVFDEVAEDRLVVVANDTYFLNVRDLCDSGETVPDDGMTCDFKERLEGELESGKRNGRCKGRCRDTYLGEIKRERSEPGSSGRPTNLRAMSTMSSLSIY